MKPGTGAEDPFADDDETSEEEEAEAETGEQQSPDSGLTADTDTMTQTDTDSKETDSSQPVGSSGSGPISGSTADRDAGLASSEDDTIPYVLRRTSVKADREDKSFPLQQSTMDLEQEIQREVEGYVDANVYDSDFREAAYIIGLQHADEVADLLLEWGYEYR